MNKENCESLLSNGLALMNINIDQKKILLLIDFLEIFHKWNKAYNLSAIREPEKMVVRHLLDSLTLVPFLQEKIDQQKKRPINILDVGTGGGLPGFPLAIIFPDINITLLDSNGKKTRFLFQATVKLGLKNISIENKRVENFYSENKFSIITSRAFASLVDMVKGSSHLLQNNGEYWAMKGVYPEVEINKCKGIAGLINADRLSLPNTGEERFLIRLKNK